MEDLYPTRGSKEEILERKDPVFYGAVRGDKTPAQHELNKEEIEFYEKNGYIIFPEFFSAEETSKIYREYQALIQLETEISEEEFICEPDSRQPRTIFNPHRYSVLFESLSKDPRVLTKVEQILGSPAYIHHARINIKNPLNGKSFPWHSDFETWHAEDGMPQMRALTAWIMLTENSEFNGPLYLIPGSHKKFVSCRGYTPVDHHLHSLRKQEYGTPSFDAINRLTREGGMAAAYGKAGTLVFHESNIMHGSPDNLSPWPRTNLFYVFNSVKNTPNSKPFAAPGLRPEFLSNSDTEPLIALGK